ncbi:MAG: DoxX family protein [Lentisphaeria bacterium]|nr:DoxX family protein [Lentisphaeria bacterium]
MLKLMKSYRSWMDSGVEKLSFELGLLIGRISLGCLMLFGHGLGKLQKYSILTDKFPDPLGIGSQLSLTLAIFAEVICSILLMIGLGTRLALTQLIATMIVAAFIVLNELPFFAAPGEKSKEMALMYLTGYIILFFTGPGKFSIDEKISNLIKKDD